MNRKIFLYPLIVLIIFVDQISKSFITKTMVLGDSLPLVANFLHISYVANTGAAFSMLRDKTGFLIIITGLALIALGVFFLKYINKTPFLASLALALIIGGGLGNMVDRCRLGYVVDFIDFRVFPVFNLADISVTLGCFALILYLILGEKKDRGKETGQN